MCEDNEDVLARLRTSLRIDEGLCDVGVVHVEITTKHTPKDSFEGGYTGTIDGTCDKLEIKLNASGKELVLAVIVLQQRRRTIIKRRSYVSVLILSLRRT